MQKFLFRPVDIASLVFFRVVFGVLGFTDVLNDWVLYHLQYNAFHPDAFRFTYFGLQWIEPLPPPLMNLFFPLLMAAALGIVVGWRYRLCSFLFFLGYCYLFLLEKSNYLNHGYLFCWVAFVMALAPVHQAFSLDSYKKRTAQRQWIPYWPLFLLQFLMGVVYIYGGIAKLNPEWLAGIPLKFWLPAKAGVPLIGPLLKQEWAAYFMAYGGLFFDLFIVWLMLMRRTRPYAFAFVLFFHGLNLLIFNIGIFPFLSVALTILYFPPDFPRRLFRRAARRFPVLKTVHLVAGKSSAGGRSSPATFRPQPVVTFGVAAICLFHLVVPLRHHVFPGNVAWTEEGHRYSWRMMLRTKQGRGSFRIVSHNSRDTTVVYPDKELRPKQAKKLYTHPDMILQYAHHLRDRYQSGGDSVSVYADIEVRLNGQAYRSYVDPEIDLAGKEWSFWQHSSWIQPLPDGEAGSGFQAIPPKEKGKK